MLKFFQKAYLSQYIVLLLLTSVFWLPSFLNGETYKGDVTFVFNLVSLVFMENAYFMNGTALVITLLLGLLFKNIAGEFDFSSKLATTSMFLFLIFTGALTSFTVFNPFILVNILLLFFIRGLFQLPTAQYSVPLVFNAALILGVSSLFYLPTVFLVVLIWMSLIIHRSNSWRNYVVSISGVFTPHMFVMIWFFWNDNLNTYLEAWTKLIHINFTIGHFELSANLVILILFLVLFIIAALGTLSRLSEKNIIPRQNQLITFYYLFFSIIIIFLFSEDLNPALMLALPGTLILSNFLQGVKRFKIYNIVLVILSILIFGNQYFRLFYPMLNLDG